MIWRATDKQGDEARKVVYDVVQYLRGTVLDLGCGPRKVLPHVVGVDSCIDSQLFGIEIHPDVRVTSCTDLSDFVDECADAIFSSHLLEHIEDTEGALREWWKKLKVGGYLVLYLPHADLYPRIGTEGANPDHKHDFTNGQISTMMHKIGCWDLLVDEVRDAGTEYSFLQVYQKLAPTKYGQWQYSALEPKPAKTVCISRFGGFGDLLQAANLLPQLKREGYHITFNTTPKGQDILRHDPHIDDWLIVDDDLVPNHELPLFWMACERRFDKFVQLSESVEGTLLAMPGRANHMWPDSVRKVELNKNYLEWTSQLAEIAYHSEAKFYPDESETIKADDDLRVIRRDHARRLLGRDPYIGENLPPVFTVMWVLSGSAQHKFYPWQDQVIGRIMLDMPEAVVIFSGDEACKLLEIGWEMEPRVVSTSGKMGIRDTLTMAQRIDCVVGPETGVMNGVAFEPNAKVLLLSHSSKDNLSKHWLNCATIEPLNTPCFPCHRLHYGMQFCHEDGDTGAALCQVNIAPSTVYDAIHAAYVQWKAGQ